ncbi:hypothetical protein CEUSTIGMA_g2177.t1 [Chlamydomonas eustigma]|uniref:Uncharacterized protein n=1 Tax=Chlamydomonas eustigma TaxID=1157962 RepID=A0A250WW28_9CHLO|nr:hypothetical protein CEUSTIGMA_g2177.t1 [Chlamydomonas eustigma]|eukprot:GAX74730.1 hypothetical protein CEUSTIGMA_g2177.t1 [Chlamydomonas eustigma]
MSDRFFLRDFTASSLTSVEMQDIQEALSSSVQELWAMNGSMERLSGGSWYVGLGGVAATLLQIYNNQSLDAESCQKCLSLAQSLCDAAITQLVPHPKKVTLLEGKSGLLALSAVIHHVLRRTPQSEKDVKYIIQLLMLLMSAPTFTAVLTSRCLILIQMLESLYEAQVRALPAGECEVLYGRSGYLSSLLFVSRHTGKALNEEILKDILLHLIREGRDGSKALIETNACSRSDVGLYFPLMYSWHGERYLGAIHGLVGILHTMLCAIQMSQSYEYELQAMELAFESTRALIQQCLPSGNLPF